MSYERLDNIDDDLCMLVFHWFVTRICVDRRMCAFLFSVYNLKWAISNKCQLHRVVRVYVVNLDFDLWFDRSFFASGWKRRFRQIGRTTHSRCWRWCSST